jgi:CCR4-NOT transcription complex subunit 6
VALMALLRHRASGQRLLAMCTHLWWKPDVPDIKLAQAQMQ